MRICVISQFRLWRLLATVGIFVMVSGVCLTCSEDSQTELANSDLLVSSNWLNENSSSLTIVDARSAETYAAGHIDGAVHCSWVEYVNELRMLKPADQLASLLGDDGIPSDDTVVVYGDLQSDPGADVRIFWMLEYLGHEDVHVLDGGFSKWLADGYGSTESATDPDPVQFQVDENAALIAEVDELESLQDEGNSIVWDVRTDEEFIGWPMLGDETGGHILGSVQFDYRRLFKETGEFEDADRFAEIMEHLGIGSETKVIATGYDGTRSAYAYFILRLMGQFQVSNYDGSMLDWNQNGSGGLVALPNYEQLVYPAWVKELVDGGNPGAADSPSTYSGNGFVIVDVGTADEYSKGHIQSAINIEFPAFNNGAMPPESPEDANLLPDADLQIAIEGYGIAADSTVVVYGAVMPNVARLAWTLMYAGVSDVRILNGGLTAWTSAGYDADTTDQLPIPTTFGMTVPGHPELVTTTEEIVNNLSNDDYVIVDIRTWDEYIGIDSHEYITTPGHIEGALFQDWATWIEEDATFVNFENIASDWQELGITSEKSTRFS